MAEYIKRETLLKAVEKMDRLDKETNTNYEYDKEGYILLIQNAPTADVAEVVRCGKCKYHKTHTCAITGIETLFCDYGNTPVAVEPTHYCSYGERRTDDD